MMYVIWMIMGIIGTVAMASPPITPVVKASLKDPLLERTIGALDTMQQSMIVMERIRKEILQKSLESVKGYQAGFTTLAHKEKMEKACEENPLCSLDGDFGTSAFEEVETIFFEPLLKYNATVTDGVIDEDATGFYDLQYTPAMADLTEAESLVRAYFFMPYCANDPVLIEAGAPPLKSFDYKDIQDRFFLRRQQYMMDLSLICFDLANEVYQATQKDLEQNAKAPIGGLCLQDDLYLSLKAEEALAKKIIIETVLQLRLAEITAARVLMTLPLRITPRPLYRQQEVARFMRMEDPTFDMDKALRKLWCPDDEEGT